MAAAPLATLVGGPVSGALLELHGLGGLKGWHWLFIVEGLPAVLLGLAALKLLTDRPAQADWLTEEEKQALEAKLDAEAKATRSAKLWPSLIWGWHSDLTGERIWHVALPLFLAGAAFAWSAVGAPLGLTITALTLATIGIYAAIGTFWSLPTSILTGTGPRQGSP
jgi:ACS family tartrate transporter-like MFS transporter